MNGMAIIERTGAETKAIYIEQEALEFARQNALTKKNRAEAEKKQREDESKRRKARKAEERRRAYNRDTARYLLTRLAVSGVVVAGWAAGLIHPAVSVPVLMFCLCTASGRLGAWQARNQKKEEKKNG